MCCVDDRAAGVVKRAAGAVRARRSLCASGAAEAVGAQPSEAKAAERSHAGDGDVGHARVEATRRLGVIDSGEWGDR